MSAQTGISWCDSTFNYWMGCTKVSPACDHCYAERDMDTRLGKVKWGAGQPRVQTSQQNRNLPLRWNRQQFAECLDQECGWRGVPKNDSNGVPECPRCEESCYLDFTVRRRVFSSSLSDWLDNEVPIEWLVGLLDTIRQTPNLDWLLLTKRIGNWRARLQQARDCQRINHHPQTIGMVMDWLGGKPPKNVWIGATMESQPVFDRDAHKLIGVPAAVRFVSIEPMLGPIQLRIDGDVLRLYQGDPKQCSDAIYAEHLRSKKLHWIICGGESGPHARPMHPDWMRSLRDQCQSAGVPFHFKQHGEWVEREPDEGHTLPWVSEETDRSTDRVIDASGDGSDHTNCSVPHAGRYALMTRVGKKAAGRMLDGREWNEFPRAAA